MTDPELQQAADLFVQARRTGRLLPALPPHLVPSTPEQLTQIQNLVAAHFGPVGGWKVGASSAGATPTAGPMPAAWIKPSGASFTGHLYRGLECEVAFRLAHDLPPRATSYSDREVYAAVASCHPAIEILESALQTPRDPALKPQQQADLQFHGGFVYGPAYPDWQALDFHRETVVLTIDGVEKVKRTGSNTSGNLLRLLPWLANAGATRTGGLRAGQWVTTGSWTGVEQASAGSTAGASFCNLGTVDLRFA